MCWALQLAKHAVFCRQCTCTQHDAEAGQGTRKVREPAVEQCEIAAQPKGTGSASRHKHTLSALKVLEDYLKGLL